MDNPPSEQPLIPDAPDPAAPVASAPNLDLLGDTAREFAPAPVLPFPNRLNPFPKRARPPDLPPDPAALARAPRDAKIVVLPPDPAAMGQKFLKLHTQNKIRQAFHHLAMNNLDAVQTWLHNVAEDSPAKAVELFIELARFSLPQLKEATLTVNKGDQARTYQSSEEIMQELNSDA